MNRNPSKQPVVRQREYPTRKKGLWIVWAAGLVGIAMCSLSQSAWATLLIYEPFAYPTGQQLTLSGTGDPTAVPTPTTTEWNGGVGFTSGSEWGIGRQGTGASIAAGIAPALRFNGLWPEGGALQIQTTGDFSTLSRGVGVTYTSGTLWASYLYQAVSLAGPGSVVDVRFTGGEANRFLSANRFFRNLGDAGSYYGGVGGGDTYYAASGSRLDDGRVYLLVAKYTNVGQSGTASWWALTQENYGAVLASGLSEAALDAHCVDKLVKTGQPANSLSGITWLQAAVYQGSAVVDQLRYGTTLADVIPPAPVRWVPLYQELFPSTGSNLPMKNVGWSAYSGASATDYTNTSPGIGDRAGVSNLVGSPSGNGFGFAVPEGQQTSPPRFLVYTNEFTPINPADYEQLWFSWRQHASGEGVGIRLAIQITDPANPNQNWWFASDTAFVNTGPLQTGAADQFPTEAVLRGMLFSPEGALWRDLTFTPGTTLSLAGSARTQDLPAGLITAAGLYLTGPNGTTMRFDTFEIFGMVVPEPSTCVLLGIGLVCLAGAVVRKQRSRGCKWMG